LSFTTNSIRTKQKSKNYTDSTEKDEFLFYDIAENEEVNFLSQPLGLLKKKKKRGTSLY
jgi:hypothetical protein